MTAKEFLTGKKLQAIEVVGNVIINLIVDGASYALAAETSSFQVGTKIQRVTEYKKTRDIITYGDITLDLATTNML